MHPFLVILIESYQISAFASKTATVRNLKL